MNTLILACTVYVELIRVISRVSILPPSGGADLLYLRFYFFFFLCRKTHNFTNILLVFLTRENIYFILKLVLMIKY